MRQWGNEAMDLSRLWTQLRRYPWEAGHVPAEGERMKRMVLIVAVAVASVASALAQGASKDAIAKALVTLQGTWVVVSINGQSTSDMGMELSLTFTEATYAQAMSGVVNERGTITIDPSKTPMIMDLNITEGDDAGKLQPGVVQIKDGVMTCKLAFPGESTRPTSLAQEEGFLLVVAKKGK